MSVQLDRPLAVVTPTADGDVLTALARVDARMTVGQVRRVLDRYSEEGIRKVLARLVAQGVVHTEQAGRTAVYWFNRDHLAADAIIILAASKDRLLAHLRLALETWPTSIAYAAVFGSAARGRMRPDSDIDLLVVHADDASELDMQERTVDLMLRTWRWTGNSLSLLPMTVSELRSRLDEPLLQDVRRDGLTVAGSRNWFTTQLRANDGRRAHA